jgi:hypothetical protein
MPDNTLVVDQAITTPEVGIAEGDRNELVVKFTHEDSGHVRVAGSPAVSG